MMSQLLRANIYKLYVIKVSHWLMLAMPVILIFYNANHLSVKHLFILQAVYSLSAVLFEIPSGYLADRWGRKNTIVIGSILGFCGYMTYSLTAGFSGFFVAELLLGIGASFISGTDTAMLYDTLIVLKEEDKYMKVEGRMTSVGNFAEAIAGTLGGLLAVVSPRLPFICQAIIALTAVPAAIMLVEPSVHGSSRKPSLKDIVQTFRNALIINKPLRQNLLLSSVIGASTLTMAWFVQPYFKTIDVPTALYGILWSVLNASVGIAALFAYKVDRKLGERNSVLLVVVLCTVGYIALSFSHTYWGILFILMFYMVRGIATPVLKDYINKMIDSSTRASVLSLRNLIIRGIFSSCGPLWGYLTDSVSLSMALLMAGMTYCIFALPFLWGYFYGRSREVVE